EGPVGPGGGPGGPGGPAADEPHGGGRGDPQDFFLAIKEAIQRASVMDANQTNTFYYLLWKEDGTLLARSPSAPSEVSIPTYAHSVAAPDSHARGMGEPGHSRPGPPMRGILRTRGESRELFRCLPHGECLLVGRSMAPDLAAMHRLALWLVAAGAGVLAV